MGKRKKSSNELDAILEQLKRSYGADIDAELEDSLLDDEKSSEDDEFSSVLAKIFSDFEDDADAAVSDAVDQTQDGLTEDTSDAQEMLTEIVVDESETQQTLAQETATEDDENVDTDPQAVQSDILSQAVEAQAPSKEHEEVDGVLSAMLHRSVLREEQQVTPNDPIQADITEESNSQVEEPSAQDEIDIISETYEIEQEEMQNQPLEDTPVEELPIQTMDDQVNSEYAEEYTEQLSADDEQQDLPIIEDSEQDELFDEISEPEYTPPLIVLDPVDYTDDPLQLDLSDLAIIKIEDDIEETQVTEPKDEPIITQTENTVLDSNDVSLLVKFGYGEEVNAQIGRDLAKKVIFERESNFSPERHKVPFGFIGKEYSDRSQDDTVRRKYKNDRFALLISLIAISAFTLISLVFGLIFEFVPNKIDYYVAIMSLDFLLVSVAALICGRRLIWGAIGIAKFESSPYSVLLILSAEYLIYNVLVSVIYAIEPILFYNSFCWISGSCILAYFAVTTLCDIINCDKEYKTFELMTAQSAFYTAEKLSPSDDLGEEARAKGHVNAAPGTYRVRKTPIIGGYFKRISESGGKSISPVYALGIVPSISLALGCFVAIVSENVIFGIHTFTMTSMLCIPLSCLCLGTVSAFINARRYRANNAAFIGENNESEYASVTTLVFDDTEAVEITSYKEINPGKNSGDVGEKLIMAYNVFKTLRGPLGEAVPDKYMSEDGHELIINSISDNGINIYFDASTNILIGDKQYMLGHNLKVKTDVNLTTATKGADRYVVYMAFDGKPQLGFVLTQRTKPDFVKAVSILADGGIAMAIESYEPEVNDIYFEQNKTSDYSVISVHKPSRYQEKTEDAVCDGSLVAKDALSLSKAISQSKGEPARKQRIKNANLLSFMIGGVLAALIALIMCFDTPIGIFDTLREHPYIALSAAIILCAIPAIINTVKEYLRK